MPPVPPTRSLSSTAERCENWRKGYAPLLRELTALAAEEPRALAIARAGIDSMRARLVVEGDGAATPLGGSFDREAPPQRLGTGKIAGGGTPATRLEIPYRGRMLHGGALCRPARALGGRRRCRAVLRRRPWSSWQRTRRGFRCPDGRSP